MKKISIYVEENNKVYDLLIGQTQKENDQILRNCDQNDTWFHLENISGPHFILQNGGENIPKRYFNQIASLFPEFKNNLPNRFSVIYTELKNVKLTKIPGQVVTSKTKVIKV
jgi:predicted ribosome quality control (RQC) complex YloA/Tae2 family protein